MGTEAPHAKLAGGSATVGADQAAGHTRFGSARCVVAQYRHARRCATAESCRYSHGRRGLAKTQSVPAAMERCACAALQPPPAALRDARRARRGPRVRASPRASSDKETTCAPCGAPLSAVLAAAHAASLAALPPSSRGERVLRGSGEALGLTMAFSLRVDSHCSFAESVTLLPPPALGGAAVATLRAGFDAASGAAWQTELADGSITALAAGDDARDRSLLFAWLRSGAWTAAVASGALLAAPLSDQAAPGSKKRALCLALSLPDSTLAARVWLAAAPAPCLPLRVELAPSCAGAEAWDFAAWPGRATHTQPTGERAVFTAGEHAASDDEPALAQLVVAPAPASPPPFAPVTVALARCSGGQVRNKRNKHKSLTCAAAQTREACHVHKK